VICLRYKILCHWDPLTSARFHLLFRVILNPKNQEGVVRMGFRKTSWSCNGHHLPISELALFWAESLVAVCTLLKIPHNRANLQTGFVITFPHSIVARLFLPLSKLFSFLVLPRDMALFRYHQWRNSGTYNYKQSIRARGGMCA